MQTLHMDLGLLMKPIQRRRRLPENPYDQETESRIHGQLKEFRHEEEQQADPEEVEQEEVYWEAEEGSTAWNVVNTKLQELNVV